MANPNFASILDQQSSGKVDRPKPLPVGNYVWAVGVPKHGESPQKKTPFVEYPLKPLQALDDVDAEALEHALTRADGTSKTLGDMSNRITFYTTPDVVWRLDKFLSDCGVLEAGKSRREIVEAAVGCQVIGTIKHTTSDDGEAIYANIAGTAKAE